MVKCPKCGTTNIDIDAENEQRGIVIRVYCNKCDYEGEKFIEEDEVEEVS